MNRQYAIINKHNTDRSEMSRSVTGSISGSEGRAPRSPPPRAHPRPTQTQISQPAPVSFPPPQARFQRTTPPTTRPGARDERIDAHRSGRTSRQGSRAAAGVASRRDSSSDGGRRGIHPSAPVNPNPGSPDRMEASPPTDRARLSAGAHCRPRPGRAHPPRCSPPSTSATPEHDARGDEHHTGGPTSSALPPARPASRVGAFSIPMVVNASPPPLTPSSSRPPG